MYFSDPVWTEFLGREKKTHLGNLNPRRMFCTSIVSPTHLRWVKASEHAVAAWAHALPAQDISGRLVNALGRKITVIENTKKGRNKGKKALTVQVSSYVFGNVFSLVS